MSGLNTDSSKGSFEERGNPGGRGTAKAKGSANDGKRTGVIEKLQKKIGEKERQEKLDGLEGGVGLRLDILPKIEIQKQG